MIGLPSMARQGTSAEGRDINIQQILFTFSVVIVYTSPKTSSSSSEITHSYNKMKYINQIVSSG
jgi:hypothetical protein